VIAMLVGAGLLSQSTIFALGHVLGGDSADNGVTTEQREQQRQARLAKFESVASAQRTAGEAKPGGAYAAAMAKSMGVDVD